MLPTIKQIEILGIVVATVVALILACYLTHRLSRVLKIIHHRRQQQQLPAVSMQAQRVDLIRLPPRTC